MLKPIITPSTNSIQQQQQTQQILSEPSTPNSTTTQNTDQSSILSPTSPNQINLQNFQLNQTSQQQQDELNDLLRQFSLVQMFNKQQQQNNIISSNDLSINNNNLNQPNYNQQQYSNNNSNQTMTNDELTNLLLNNVELNNNNPLAINNNIIGNTTSNNLQFTNDSLLSINQHLHQQNSQYYQQPNLNSYQQSNLSNLHQQTTSNRIPPNCSPNAQHQQINRIKPRSVHIMCKFGKLGQSSGCLSSPHGFCLGVDEEIVIADTFNHRICIFEKTGQFKHQFGLPGKDDGQLWYPRKVGLINTRNDSPRYVVCDRGSERSRMQIFSKDGQFMHRISIKYVDIVAGLVVTSDGLIVVVDSVSASLFVIREDGKALHKIECKQYMTEPSDIAVFRNHFYICDFKGHCVVVFNSDGQFVRKIGNDKITNYPNGIDIANNGDIIIGDSHGNKFHIVVYSEDGKFLREFECSAAKVSRCCGLRITKEGYIVTLAKNNHHVLILDALFNLSNGQHNQQSINNSSIQNQSFTNKTNQLLSFLNNNINTSTTSSQLNGHNSPKEDIDFENFDALFNLSNGQHNQQSINNSLIQNHSFASKTSELIPFLNNNTSTTSSQLLNGHNSSKEDIDFGVLDAVTQNNLMNLLALCDQSATTNDRNDSTVSDLNSSIIDSIATSPIPQTGKTSNLFLDSNISALQHQFNNNNHHNNSSKAKNVMTIEHKFGHLGSGKGEFSSPHGFCIGHEDEIIIADTFNHRICVFSQAGEYIYEFGIAGKEKGELWHPRKVAVTKIQASASCHERQNLIDQTKFVVCDRGNEKSRMQIFSRNGQFIRKICITYIDIVAGLAITPSNNIVAVDSVQPTVFLIEEEGNLIRWFDTSSHMREPSDIAVNDDLLYICDFKGHQVVVFNDQGVFLRTIGNESITKFPNGIEVSSRGDIIVGDSHGNRFHVVVFNKNGKALKEFECPYVKVSRCCGLKLTENGNIVTLAKNNHHVLVLRGISVN